MTMTLKPGESTKTAIPKKNAAALQAAKALLPLLQQHAGQSELERRLAPQSADAMRAAGLFQLLAPRRVGGFEADVRTYVDVCTELSKGDSAAGWVAMVLNGNAMLMGFYPDAVRAQVYGENPVAGVAGQWAPTAKSVAVEGGWKVTGKWMWASGCYQAQWNIVGFPVFDEYGESMGTKLGLVPTSDLSIEDTWFVAGMSGTGSNTFVANDVFIPLERTLWLKDVIAGVSDSEHADEPLYRSPLVTLLPLGICGAIVGMAESAWDMTLANLAKGRAVQGSIYTDARECASYQLNLADARAAIDSARLHLNRAVGDVDTASAQGLAMNELARARVRLDQGVTIKRAREALDLLLNIGGASSFANVNPLQRVWRDIEVASRHAYVNGDLGREIYARAVLGLAQVSEAF